MAALILALAAVTRAVPLGPLAELRPGPCAVNGTYSRYQPLAADDPRCSGLQVLRPAPGARR
eukprot:CAMPEP_0119277892 /NCGR_PEP_ID=MMETSP1329-20130426/18092_1 /TAXON_ID=114041 /ORGANISM="Genus nov. species nov., Strain RCC1024" /LENGTH=61 /DNA_ID=CAMNT_0007278385 /DNA_START=258 /DNA_END=439 /DNA_ORIENTATION=+